MGGWNPSPEFMLQHFETLSRILDSKAQDSEFNDKNFPGFRIRQAKISQIPESGFPYIGPFQAQLSKADLGARNKKIIKNIDGARIKKKKKEEEKVVYQHIQFNKL